MVSISSKRLIKKRAKEFWDKNRIWQGVDPSLKDMRRIEKYLAYEYKIIPDKERVGKGSVYIAKVVAEGVFPLILSNRKLDTRQLLSRIRGLFAFGEQVKNIDVFNLACCLLAEYSTIDDESATEALRLCKKWANHDDWRVREMSGYTIRKSLKNFKETTISIIDTWLISNNENTRRVVIESIRPLRDIKWLRDPAKNDLVIKLLGKVRADESEYVRKSVGNNLKDLSKYMPQKILDVAADWLSEARIETTEDLASYRKADFDSSDDFYLVWTLKQALRWIRKKNPKYHPRLEDIMGKNYVLYFDEKRNRRARPKK